MQKPAHKLKISKDMCLLTLSDGRKSLTPNSRRLNSYFRVLHLRFLRFAFPKIFYLHSASISAAEIAEAVGDNFKKKTTKRTLRLLEFDQLNNQLSALASELNKQSSRVASKGETDYLLFALRGIVSYASSVFERHTKSENLPIEYLAFSARNLFECYLLITYIINDSLKAKEFISQKAFDEIEINQGFLSLTNSSKSPESIKMIEKRIDDIMMFMKNHELTPSKHWSVGLLATNTNQRREYEAFFKLYSKYLHPSSWRVNSWDAEYNNPVFRSIFVSQGEMFARRIVRSLNKYKGT